MKAHTKIYLDAFGLDVSDSIHCECCTAQAQATHHIEARKMGGRPNNDMDRIENLMAICRYCDTNYGDKKAFKSMLYKIHERKMKIAGVKFDKSWIDEQINKHEVNTD